MKRAIVILVWAGWAASGLAQEVVKKKSRFDHIQVSTGGELGTSPMLMSSEDFSKLAPNSSLYASTPMEDIRMGLMFSWNASSFNVQLGWRPALENGQDKSQHRAWRVGLIGQSFQTNLYSRITENTVRIDTLYQASTGAIYGFIDSTERFYTNGYYRATTLKVDVSHVWSTGWDRRFNLYTGIGVNAGVNLAPKTQIVSNRWSSAELIDADGQVISSTGTYNSSVDFQRETYYNKTGWTAAAYLPIGWDFRVGQKREYLKNLHFFSEIRPTLNYVRVPETRGYLFPTIQSTMGLKWCW